MSNLIREQRVDKNGNTNTKLVRAAPKAAGGRAIPAPKGSTTTARRPSKGTAEYFPLLYKHVTPEVASIPAKDKLLPHVVIPDSVMYDLCSLVNPVDALALFNRGIKSKSAALKALKKHGATGALLDRSKLMQKAQDAGIPAAVFTASVREHPPEGKEVQDYIDGAILHGTKAARDAKMHLAVMDGRARLSDIKAIGVSRMTRISGFDSTILGVLEGLKAGSVPYDAKGFRELLETKSKHLQRAVNVANLYGTEFACSVKDVVDSWNIHLHLERVGYDATHEKAIMTYGDTLNRQAEIRENEKGLRRRPYLTDDLPRLYESGVDAETVASKLNEGMSVHQIIGHLQHDVPLSVSEGWL